MSEQAIHHDGRQRVQVEALTPGSAVDPYPVKRIVGLRVEVAADIVADDVRQGYVSVESAERDYGVICDAAGNLDTAATEKARASA